MICPDCGSTRLVEIIYGLPGLELAERAERGEVALGGCTVGAPSEDPTHQCLACGRSYVQVVETSSKLNVTTQSIRTGQNPLRPH